MTYIIYKRHVEVIRMHLPDEFIDHPIRKDLSIVDFAIYKMILELSQKDGYCYASQAYMAKQLNCNEATISRSIKQLNSLRLISISKASSSGSYSRNNYTPIQPLDYVNGKRATITTTNKYTNHTPVTQGEPITTFDSVISYCLDNYQETDIDKYSVLTKAKSLEQGRKTKALKIWKENQLTLDAKVNWFINLLIKSLDK